MHSDSRSVRMCEITRGPNGYHCERCGQPSATKPGPPRICGDGMIHLHMEQPARGHEVRGNEAPPQSGTPCPHRKASAKPGIDIERHILSIPYHAHSRTIAAVSCYFNPHGSQSRQRALCPFVRQWHPLGLDLYTIEASTNNTWHIPAGPTAQRVAIDPAAVLFHKEALLNIAIERLPDRYTHVLWIDSDVVMLAHDYVDRLTDALAEHRVVQGFAELQYIGPHGEPQTGWRSSLGKHNEDAGTKSANPSKASVTALPPACLRWAMSRQRAFIFTTDSSSIANTSTAIAC